MEFFVAFLYFGLFNFSSYYFFIFKLEFKTFQNKIKEKPSSKKVNNKTSSYNGREININSVFSKSLFILLRKYNYILVNESCTYEEVKDMMLNSEQRVFRFKNANEAKRFYNEIFRSSNIKIEDYCKMLGCSYRSLKGDPKEHLFSVDFQNFLEELNQGKC